MAVTGGLERVRHDRALSARRRGRVRRPTVLLLLVVVASALFVGYGWRTISASFGDSHDGRNAGVWVASGRALRESPMGSRLGARSSEHGLYANHPPLIALEVVVAETVAGDSPAASRAPAWMGSLAGIVLLTALLRERGLRRPAVGVAVVVTVATPMFLVFGTMLDTPVTSLPFGLGLLLLWERARRGRRVNRPLAAGLALLAVLAGWQSLLVAGAVAVWALARVGCRRAVDEAAFVAGAVAGAGLLAAWIWWASGGSVRPLFEAYLFRTGGPQPVPIPELLARQLTDVRVMFGAAVVPAVVGFLAALARRSTRGLAGVAAAVTLPYPVVFRTGAVNHEYWDYWFVLPLAIGLATGGDWVLGALGGRRRAELAVAGTGLALAGAMALAAWLQPTPAGLVGRPGRPGRRRGPPSRAPGRPGRGLVRRRGGPAGLVDQPAHPPAGGTRRPRGVRQPGRAPPPRRGGGGQGPLPRRRGAAHRLLAGDPRPAGGEAPGGRRRAVLSGRRPFLQLAWEGRR